MRWKGRKASSNVDDRRSTPGKKMAVGGGIGTLAIVVIVMLLGGNPEKLLNQMGSSSGSTQGTPVPTSPEEDKLADFVSVVLADTEDVWHEQFRKMGKTYKEPQLILFKGSDQSGCGFASAATGPFYCPADQKVYIDLAFCNELKTKFKAPGDFAIAYVIAHEVGHHIQHILGITDQVHSKKGRISEKEYNQLSVRLELQADFLAGAWAHHAQRMHNILEKGDIEEALRAANAIGDDRLQKQAQGYTVPDSFTHGTSEQRQRWFKKGLESGNIADGDTFNATYL